MLGMNNVNYQMQGQSKLVEKDPPIIINNIMKSPMDLLDKDLIEKEIKIRLLQNQRESRMEQKRFDMKYSKRGYAH